jgi:pyrimidine-specific ribonucleoside hydrolase
MNSLRHSRRPAAGALLAAVIATLIAGCGSASTSATATAPSTTETTAVQTTVAPATSAAPATTTTALDREGLPVVMDTDMAVEGAMSILYLLGKPEIDVRAITVSGTGLVHCAPGVRQALGLVELAGAGEIPVACGPEQPLEGINAFPTSWRVGADDLYGVDLPEGGAPSDLPAPELLVSVIEEAGEPVVVYADGPMTNLAAALRLEPAITGDIAGVVAMGGAVGVPGNTIKNPDAEWNVWVDPVAAAEVFASGVPISLVPLDATSQVPLNAFHLRALQAHRGSGVADVVAEMLAGDEQLKSGVLYFWDQLAAALLVDQSLATFETMDLEVVTEGPRDAAGATLAGGGSPVSVAVAVDVERFEREFLSVMAGEPIGPIAKDADITVGFDGEEWAIDAPASLPAGEAVLSFANSGAGDALVALGRLTGGATEQDLEATPFSVEPPPFFELDGYGLAPPGDGIVVVVALGVPGSRYVTGLDLGAGEKAVIARIEVGG